MWEGETVVRMCDSSQGGVKVLKSFFQLRGGDVRGCEKV